ncbi:MAG TPA: hypothetical protein P5186_14935 [Candidatus Paceibacterota bacterium]|nr:hypothetical protein [Verrucomicrobiota bacterium]HRY49342.1 hypothetical protein [Candidatus Paceibacterota bacterium]HSA02141.1 hypothetical protein [Candidatus Paceibacterota bacterium]
MLLALWLGSVITANAAYTNILYSTRFEAEEGFLGQYTLAGQGDWLGEGTGGNGLVTNFFPGLKQQAFLGYFPPTTAGEDFSTVWHPINYVPTTGSSGQVLFTVDMSVIDSTTTNRDEFRWSIYNADGANAKRLFSLNFDNLTQEISFSLDDGQGFVFTGHYFSNAVVYNLAIEMTLASNRWSAFLDETQLVKDEPITTTGATLSLGDVAAVWAIANPTKPGENYLLFDNYTVTTASQQPAEPEASIEYVAHLPGGEFLLRMKGPPGKEYAMDYTWDLMNWIPLKTNTIGSDGWLDFIDTTAFVDPRRFYRARRTAP